MAVRSYLDGAVIVEVAQGAAPPILALHGWGRTRRDLTALVEGREALVPDLPGFGSSPEPPEAWGAHDYARCLAELLTADSRGPYVVAAHSFGGRAAVALVADSPALVSGLVLYGVPLLRASAPARPKLSYRLVRWGNRRGIVGDARLEALRERYGSADYKAAQGVMRGVLVRSVAEEYADELRQVKVPVGFCWGERDTAAPLAAAERAAALVPDLRFMDVVAGVGHDVILQSPDRARAALERIVDQACLS
jgi:pimeloyl-ACP methyl ester carboxylesterase